MSTSYHGSSDSYAQPSGGYAEPTRPYASPPYGQHSGEYQNYAANPYSGQAGVVQPYAVYATTPALPEHPNSTLVLVLGIVSLVGLAITGPFAWYFGAKARKEVRENPGQYRDSGALTAGWVLGIIGTVFLGIYALCFLLYLVMVAAILGSIPHH